MFLLSISGTSKKKPVSLIHNIFIFKFKLFASLPKIDLVMSDHYQHRQRKTFFSYTPYE